MVRAPLSGQDPWLPDSNPYIISAATPYNQEAKVCNIMEVSRGEWDHDLLSDILEPRDVSLILKIPISLHYEDSWFWKDDLKGVYTVKSGYRRLVGDFSSPTLGFAQWNTLWKLRVPPKIKFFLWRCLVNVLPTNVALVRRHVDISPMCPRCNLHNETVNHVFFECIYAEDVWHSSEWRARISQGADLDQVLTILFTNGVAKEAGRLCCLLWSIWVSCNAYMWDNRHMSSAETLCHAGTVFASWTTANSGNQ